MQESGWWSRVQGKGVLSLPWHGCHIPLHESPYTLPATRKSETTQHMGPGGLAVINRRKRKRIHIAQSSLVNESKANENTPK